MRRFHLLLFWFGMARNAGHGEKPQDLALCELLYFHQFIVYSKCTFLWVEQPSGKRIISTFCCCWLICKNTETHILLNNTNNLHLKFICLVPWSPTEQNVCNKYSCAGDTFALEKTKSCSLVQGAYRPKEVREEFRETWLLLCVCYFPNVSCTCMMAWFCWLNFLNAGMPFLFNQPSKACPAF